MVHQYSTDFSKQHSLSFVFRGFPSRPDALPRLEILVCLILCIAERKEKKSHLSEEH